MRARPEYSDGVRHLVAAALGALLATGALASDFGFARVRGAARGESYGAVTFRPFSSSKGALIPLFVLVDAGDHSRPWLRAKQVAHLLPKAVELMLAGEVVKLGADADGRPGLFVGPAGRGITRSDLQVVSVLPRDVQRFRREKGETRHIGATDVAAYWQLLLEDLVTVFVRFPLKRDPSLADRLNLSATRSGVLLKRMMVEVGVLLRYEDLTLERATATQVKAKTLEVLNALTREQWAQLAELAFRVPAELDLTAGAAPAPPAARPLPPLVPDPDEPAPTSQPVQLYVEPDRSVWPGTGPAPPGEDDLKNQGEVSTGTPGEAPRPGPALDDSEQAELERLRRLREATAGGN